MANPELDNYMPQPVEQIIETPTLLLGTGKTTATFNYRVEDHWKNPLTRKIGYAFCVPAHEKNGKVDGACYEYRDYELFQKLKAIKDAQQK